jgi:hypothetical protein
MDHLGMIKKVFAIGCLLSVSQSLAQTKISKENLKLFDQALVQTEESECLKFKPTKDWISSEIKKLTSLAIQEGSTSKILPTRNLKAFKIDEKVEDALWEKGSPDTKGDLVKAPIVDLNSCMPLDIQKHADLENKIWLVEETSAIPDLLALTLEAKLHKAVALLIYNNNSTVISTDEKLALPVLRISKTLADKLKSEAHEKLSAEFSLLTEAPVKKSSDWVTAKIGDRDVSLAIVADNQDCKAISILLGVMEWQKKTSQNVQGTVFGFISDENTEVLGHVPTIMNIEPTKFDSEKFLKNWIKSDQQIADVIDGKSVIKRALADTANFQGLIDKDILNQYKSDLKTLENVVKVKPDVAFKLRTLYQSDDLSTLALDLKNLKLVHDLAQKGQWEKAVLQFKKIRDYQWATNVSTATFLEYRRLTQKDLSVDANLWSALQKGPNSLDGFIEALEVEIDRLELLLSDNFFKTHKSIENLDKI